MTKVPIPPAPDFEHPPERNPNASFTLSPEAIEALKGGNTIEAIKIIRDSTGVGLAEAKAIVDEIRKSMPEDGFAKAAPTSRSPTQRLAPGQVAPAGGPGKWLALIAVAVVAIVAAMFYR